MQTSSFIRLVRGSACYDLLVTWPFALPWTFAWIYAQLASASTLLGLPGSNPPLDAVHVMLANLLGSVVIVWSLARLLTPTIQQGRLDALARALFAVWQVHAVLAGASAVILVFTVFEVLFGIAQLLPVQQAEGGRSTLLAPTTT